MKRFDPTKPCRTKGGRAVRILCTDMKAAYNKPIVALVAAGNGIEYPFFYTDSGICYNEPSPDDLVNISEKHEVTVYFCYAGDGSTLASSFEYRNPIAKKTITFEEGEGLEEVG